MNKPRWEEILEEFGHPEDELHSMLERELAEHIAELEETIKMITEPAPELLQRLKNE